MNTILLVKRFFLAFTIVFFVSCDTDFTEIGSNVVDGDIHNSLTKFELPIVAYDKATGPVQTNNLTVNTMGVYNNPVFGRTVASYVTQVQLASANVNPTFYTPVLDSVWIYVPYSSNLTAAATTVSTAKYTLNGVYGDTINSFKLDIRRNNFYLRDSDAGSGGTAGQKYYSDDKETITGSAGVSLLQNGAIQDFRYSAGVQKRDFSYTPETAGATPKPGRQIFTPGIYLPLNKAIFEDLIFAAANRGNLLNNAVFTNYFRGLYFEVTPNNADRSIMGTPDFTRGVITMKYRDITATTTTMQTKTLTLNLTGNRVNFFTNENNADYITAVTNSDNVVGDDRLYIKGGEGSMAFLDIDSTALSALEGGEKTLINEANLIFYVDQEKMRPLQDINRSDSTKLAEPLRILLYDAKNKRPLYDYYLDGTTNTSFPKYSKYIHGGLLERDQVTRRGARYKIRLTEHINNLINKDSTNVKLGLVVTEDINTVTNSALRTPWSEPWAQGIPSVIPSASVMHEFGTVLYGTNIPVGDPNYDKRLKLEVFYTKPE